MNPFFSQSIVLAQGAAPAGNVEPVRKALAEPFEWLILIGALLLVSAVVAVWAIASQKKRRPRSHHRRFKPPAPSDNHHRHRHRSRRRRSDHPKFPMNPTLSQTGGLPPERSDDLDGSFGGSQPR